MTRLNIERKGLGINFDKKRQAQILVWAPEKESVYVSLNDGEKIDLQRDDVGYWHGVSSNINDGTNYTFVIDGKPLPDPASVYQPDGVFESSRAIDLDSYQWMDTDWKNPPLEEYIIYELHTGTFTAAGNFDGIIEKIPHLLELGVTAIELMPVAQFPGRRNWGYDGVFPFAVQESYGGPGALQKLVNACHSAGIAVILDVVYNHLGPEGNIFSQYGPYFTDKYKTPWGDAINFDDEWSDEVRRFFIENALMWFRDFHIDALRLDAVHAIKDFGARHFLLELRGHVDELMKFTRKKHHLIIECDLNDRRFLDTASKGGYGMDAQWTDEFHHSLRVATGQEQKGYYADFNGVEHLAKAYNDAYVYDGIYSTHRKRTFGSSAEGISGNKFIVFSQNHDQVGNRMSGERTSSLVSFEMLKVLAGAVFISPYIPLLFMGEEWGETNPFLYFVNHSGDKLSGAVREGRKKEFAAFHDSGTPPDPTLEQTFRNSALQWNLVTAGHHKVLLEYYKTLIALRKQNTILNSLDRHILTAIAIESANVLLVHRSIKDMHQLCIMNFSKNLQVIDMPDHIHTWMKIWDSGLEHWNGNYVAKEYVKEKEELFIGPESILIYTNSV